MLFVVTAVTQNCHTISQYASGYLPSLTVASMEASSNPISGLATCSVIIATVDPNSAEISGTESLP